MAKDMRNINISIGDTVAFIDPPRPRSEQGHRNVRLTIGNVRKITEKMVEIEFVPSRKDKTEITKRTFSNVVVIKD